MDYQLGVCAEQETIDLGNAKVLDNFLKDAGLFVTPGEVLLQRAIAKRASAKPDKGKTCRVCFQRYALNGSCYCD